MPKITNEATLARPDTDTTPDDVTTPPIPTALTPDDPTAGPSEGAGQEAADAAAHGGPAPADTGPDTAADRRDGPDTPTPADPPTPPAEPTPEARTTTRIRGTKPKVSDAPANGTTRKKTRTTTATKSAPAPDADPTGSPAADTTADSGPHEAPVDVATAPTVTPEHPTNGEAAQGHSATERTLRANPSGSVRLKSGALQGLVEDFLTEHPGDHSPTAVGKAIARSSGAVANALDRMVATGWATRTCDKPKRYRIAEGGDNGPADVANNVATDDTATEDSRPTGRAASDSSAADAAPTIDPNGADQDIPTASAPPAEADAPTAGRRTRGRTKTT